MCGTSRHDERHLGIRFSWRVGHLRHFNINRFSKSRRYGAGDLLGVTEHRLVDHRPLSWITFSSVMRSGRLC